MTRAEKLFVIIWIINLIIAVVYFLCGTFLYVPAMKRKDKDKEEYLHDSPKAFLIRMIIMILCPVVGLLYFFSVNLVFRTIFRQEVDLADVVFSKERVKQHLKADEDRERNLVPMEEALAVSDKKNLRMLMLNVIRGDLKSSLESIALALNSEDSETSHYAASVLRDELNDFRVHVQDLYMDMKAEEQEQTEAEMLLIDSMSPILRQKVFTGMEQVKFVHIMDEAAQSLYQKNPSCMTPKRYEVVCLQLIEQKEFEKAGVWCERLAQMYPDELVSYTCQLKLFFMGNDRSVAVGDNGFEIYTGKDTPKQIKEVKVNQEIKSVFHSDSYFGFVLLNQEKSGYELRMYNQSGDTVFSKEIQGDYSHVKMDGDNIILYDGSKCCIYTTTGILKFKGDLGADAQEIFDAFGLNRYYVMSDNELRIVYLTK